jgi:hypothetical protein
MATYVRLRGLSRRPFRVVNGLTSAEGKISYNTIQTVDLDDMKTLRRLRTSGEGRYITASDNYFNLSQQGNITATSGTASGLVVRAPRDLVIKGIDVSLGTNSGTVQYDVKYCTAAQGPNAAGTSIFGTVTADRPTIGTGSFADSSNGVTNTTWSEGNYLRVEVAAISGTATNAAIVIRADQI